MGCGRWDTPFGIFFSILTIKGPASTGGLFAGLDQDIAFDALMLVEGGLIKLFFLGIKKGAIVCRRIEKEGVIIPDEFDALMEGSFLQPLLRIGICRVDDM